MARLHRHARHAVLATMLVAVPASIALIGSTPAADYDGDARADLAVFTSNGDWVVRTSGSAYASSLTQHSGVPNTPVIGDFDGDGKRDFGTYRESTGDWNVLLSSTNYTTTLSASWGGPRYKPVVADYDGDGKADFAVWAGVGAYDPYFYSWYVLESSTNYTSSRSGGPGPEGVQGYRSPVPGLDFDGDGKADRTVYNRSTFEWEVSKSTGGYTLFTFGAIDATLVPGDYDGDGFADYGLYFRATGRWLIATSSVAYSWSIDVTLGGVDAAPVPDDYDGDGRTDLAVCERRPGVAGKWSVRKSSANFAAVETLLDGFGDVTDTLLTTAVQAPRDQALRYGDVDGDRRFDLTVYNPAIDTNWQSLLSTWVGSTPYVTTLNTRGGGSGWAPVYGDFDGDGRGDRVLYQAATGQWYVILSGGNFTQTLAMNVGGPDWKPVPADYDGDGRTDFAVHQATTGLWYALKSSSNYTTSLSMFWGGGTFGAVPADFDGDGRADLGAYLDGTWYLLLSEFSYTTARSVSFGISGSGLVGIAADYDADGLADPGFYNPANGTWSFYFFGATPTIRTLLNFGGPGWVPLVGGINDRGFANPFIYQPATGKWRSGFLPQGQTFEKAWGGAGYTPVPQFP